MKEQTTSNSAHETLALATLLDLRYEDTKIEEAGLTKRGNMTDEFMEDLVCEFWRTFHKSYRHAIPPGVIFLPGEKIKQAGFGWAPKTWMSAHEVDYPNPLYSWNGKTDLVDSGGLRVKYPGFILHTHGKKLREKILFMNQDSHITFPADRNLIEWYNIKLADSIQHASSFLPGIADDSTQLAIILSRPRPVASPPEIGLLVEIYRTEENRIVEDDGRATRPEVFSCHIIRRVQVWRDMLPKYLAGPDRNGPPLPVADHNIGTDTTRPPHWEIIGGSLPASDFCLGEAIPPEQPWLVDGYQHTRRSKSAENRTNSSIQLNSEPREIGPSLVGSLWERFFGPKESPETEPVGPTRASLPGTHKHKSRSLNYPPREESSAPPSPAPGLRRQRTLW